MIKELLSEKKKKFSSLEDVVQTSDQRLRRLLRHALTHSIFYRRYYADHGITFKDTEGIRIEDLPFTSKDILMKNFDEVSSDPAINSRDIDQFIKDNDDYRVWYRNKYKIIKTSGSSGNYGAFVYDQRAWDILRAMLVIRASYVKMNPFRRNKLAIIVDTKGLQAGI